jgi:hypothetical protein
MTFRTTSPRRARRGLPGFAALAASLLIAACGSSSTSTSTSTSRSSKSSASTSANRTAFVKCLEEHGVTPPAHRPEGGASTNRSGPPPGFKPGSGAGNSARAAAFKACGATGQRPTAPAP